MEKHEKAIMGLLTAGLVADALKLVAALLVRSFPEIVLQLMHEEISYDGLHKTVTNPLLYLRPVLHFVIMLLLFFLLRSECKKPSALSGLFPVLVPVTAIVLSAAGTVISYFVSFYMNRINDVSVVAANNMLNTASSLLTLFIPSGMLFFILAAGAIWYRRKQMQE
ncbi:MAG: hypothetical protein J5753_07110 [Oscillospiraceae bacterium]|nr:hypothetical protein [Oscillospiraceae bacterium]